MALTVQGYCNLLVKSKLLTPGDVRSLYQRWVGVAKDSIDNVDHFAKWLVSNKNITNYQATMLLRGHADHFFLGQYKLLDRIGQGRMAGVYQGVHQLGQMVAIKVLPPSRAKDPHMFARFQREARLALRLQHPNVVRTFQVAEGTGLHYLVMEYLAGEDLAEVLERRGKLPPAEAARVVYQALQGLQHLHEKGVVHRDLKPSNLMLIPSPCLPDNTLKATVKVLDIGLGRALFDEGDAAGGENLQLTTDGALLGTPDYLAPEQARNAHTADIRADVYSLGCVLFQCLAGQVVFPDKNIVNKMVKHASETPRPLRDFNPAVPEGLQAVVSGMMAKDPAQRFPTPAHAAQALAPFLPQAAEAAGAAGGGEMQAYLTWLQANPGSIVADVDLVPVSEAPTAATPAIPPKPVNRRDALIYAIGIGVGLGGVATAVGLGWLIVSWLRHK